jgi:hypothetical protein
MTKYKTKLYSFGIHIDNVGYNEAIKIECPYCNAPVGEKCGPPVYQRNTYPLIVVGRTRKLSFPHHNRMAAALGLSGFYHSNNEIDHDKFIANVPATHEEAERRSVLWAERALEISKSNKT